MFRFTIRMLDSLHEKLKEIAEQEGVSMNQYIVFALARQAYDPDGTGSIQPAPPVAEQRRQMRERRQRLGPPATDEEMALWLAERQAARKEALW